MYSLRKQEVALCALFMLALIACPLTLRAEEEAPAVLAEQPAAKQEWSPPQVQAVYIGAPPVIDGKLDDASWEQAARLEGFFVPNQDRPVPEETIGLICVDEKAIYFAAICRDRTPEDIKAVETRRNGEIWSDDWVELSLDCSHQHGDTYWFDVTPRGTQFEWIPGGSATKIEWRGDWTAAAAITAEGWTAEMAIPFSILRYEPGQATFGFSIWRGFAQERVEGVYPRMEGRSFNSNQAADLVGLRPPTIEPRPILMPYLTLDMGDAVGRRFDTGLDVQYRLPSGLTALAAVNPDFKQIEDVVEPISFSYTERYLPDPRPFFTTGRYPYMPDELLLYTRRIRDFDAGIKLFGTIGNDTIGILDTITYGQENSLGASWRHKSGPDSHALLSIISHQKTGEPGNLVYGTIGSRSRRCPEGSDNVWWSLWWSGTEGAPFGGYYQAGGGHRRGSGRLRYNWEFRVVDPGFNPALGYFYDQNSIGGSFDLGEWDSFESGRIEHKNWNTKFAYRPYRDGSGVYESRFSHERGWSFRRGYYVGLGFARAREFNQDSSGADFNLGWNTRDMHRNGAFYAHHGVRAGGAYRYYAGGQSFRPSKHLSVKIEGEYSSLAPPAEGAGHQYQTVLTASYDLTAEKCISARVIKRNEGTTAYAAYRQVVRRGMDAYVLVGDPDPARTGFTRRVAVKFIWVF